MSSTHFLNAYKVFDLINSIAETMAQKENYKKYKGNHSSITDKTVRHFNH